MSGSGGPNEETGIWILPIEDGRLRKLRDKASGAVLAPDDSRIAFLHGNEIWLMNIDGHAPRRLAAAPPGYSFTETLTWSLDGRSLAYGRRSHDGDAFALESRDLDTGRTTQLLSDPRVGGFCWAHGFDLGHGFQRFQYVLIERLAREGAVIFPGHALAVMAHGDEGGEFHYGDYTELAHPGGLISLRRTCPWLNGKVISGGWIGKIAYIFKQRITGIENRIENDTKTVDGRYGWIENIPAFWQIVCIQDFHAIDGIPRRRTMIALKNDDGIRL